MPVDVEADMLRRGSPTSGSVTGLAAAHDALPSVESPCAPRPWSWPEAASAPRYRPDARSAKMSRNPVAVGARHAAEGALALGGELDDLHAAVLRRGPAARSALARHSRSTRPVTLPFVTIMRCDNSPSVMPSGVLSSWASTSNRGSVMSELLAQTPPHLALDHGRAGEQAQPQPQLGDMIGGALGGPGLGIARDRGKIVHHTILRQPDRQRRAGDRRRLRRAQEQDCRRDLLRLDQARQAACP